MELFLNGKSLGVKDFASTLHLSWEAGYEPGVLKAIGKKDEKIVCTEQIRTAGKPAKVALTAAEIL